MNRHRILSALACGASSAVSATLFGLASGNPHALTTNPALGALVGLGVGYWIGGKTR